MIQPKARSPGQVGRNTAQVKWKIKEKTFRLLKTSPPWRLTQPHHLSCPRQKMLPTEMAKAWPELPIGKVQLWLLQHWKLQASNAEEKESLLQCTDPYRQQEAGEGKKKNALKILLTGWKMKAKWNTAQSVKTKSQQAHWKEKNHTAQLAFSSRQ